MQRLQRQHRGHPGSRQRRPAERGEQVGVISVREHLRPVRGQEREHAPRRDQVPGQQLSVGELPGHPLETLHEPIIPAHRTQSRQTRQEQRSFSAGS